MKNEGHENRKNNKKPLLSNTMPQYVKNSGESKD